MEQRHDTLAVRAATVAEASYKNTWQDQETSKPHHNQASDLVEGEGLRVTKATAVAFALFHVAALALAGVALHARAARAV